VDSTRLVPEVDHAQRLVEHRVEHVEDVVSGYSEDGVDPFRPERTNEEVTTGGFGHSFSRFFNRGWEGLRTNFRPLATAWIFHGSLEYFKQ
jgi:hypothetical protein